MRACEYVYVSMCAKENVCVYVCGMCKIVSERMYVCVMWPQCVRMCVCAHTI
jgi:hypothetical protein